MKHFFTLLVFLAILSVCNAQWVQIPSPYSGNLWAIKFFNQNTGYIGGNTVMLKTTDGGISWTSISITNFLINDFSFPSATIGYYGANNNIIAKTTDQGLNWVNQDPNVSPFAIYSVSFPTTTTGYAVGGTGVVRKTTNGGTTWATQNAGLTADANRVHFFDVNTGLIVGNNGKIKRTVNGGSSWTTITSGTTSHLKDIFFVDANTGFICGASGIMFKTTNGGVSWSVLTTGTTEYLSAVCFKNTLEGYAGGYNGKLIKTTNGGVSWQPVTSSISQQITDIVYINNRFIGVTTQGKIITDVALTSLNQTADDNAPVQIFPNPATDIVKIHLAIENDFTANVEIMDSKGALMKSIVTSKNQFAIHIDDLKTGTYVVGIRSKEFSVYETLIIQR